VRLDLQKIWVFNEYYLLDYFLTGPDRLQAFLAGTYPQTDDRVTVEYESARVLSREESWRDNFSRLLSVRAPATRYLSGPQSPDPTVYSQFYNATSANLEGQLFFLLRRKADAKRSFIQAWRLNPTDRDPYEFRLLF